MCGRFRKKTNHDWWESLENAAKKHQIKWEWVKGHAGHPENERCDQLAVEAAGSGKLKVDIEYEQNRD